MLDSHIYKVVGTHKETKTPSYILFYPFTFISLMTLLLVYLY